MNFFKKLIMHVIHPCITLMFNMCCYATAIDSRFGTIFIKTSKVRVNMVQPWPSWTAPSTISCVARCLQQFKSCYSVIFDEDGKTCTPGAWLTPSRTPRDLRQGALYTSGAFCDTSVGFNVTINGALITCTRISTFNQTYVNAKTDCNGKRSHLYTLKTPEKLDSLRYFYPRNGDVFWVGLDDLDKRGVYRWADDGSVLTQEMESFLFQQGHPDNRSSPNCAIYNGYAKTLIDIPCVEHWQYLCEVTLFSLLDIEEFIRN